MDLDLVNRSRTEVALSRPQKVRELTVLLSNNDTTTRYPAIVARELRLFERAGLSVAYLGETSGVDFVGLLANGAADMVMLDAPETLQAADERLPIASVYESMQAAPDVLSVVADGPIESLADLRGKTIGLASQRDLVTARLVLRSAGIDISEVHAVVVGDHGPVVAQALRDGDIVAYAASINDTTVLGALGIATRDLTPAALKSNPANTFTVWRPRLEELRSNLETFFRVWAMATRAAKLDPDAVARMCRETAPEEWQDAAAGQALLDAAIALNYSSTDAFGDLEHDVWNRLQRDYLAAGLIGHAIDPASFLDGSLIAAANAFDDAEILAALKEWHAA
jgi:NitT/TauT family transport system substrate-binding protein